MNDKKIFIAADIFPPEIGGPATYSSALASELTKRGYEVRVLYYGHIHQKKIKTDYKTYLVSKRWPLFIRYFLYFIKLFFLSYSFPVIYAQGPVTAGLPSWWVCKLLDKRLVVKVVGDYAWEQARVYHRSNQDIDAWQIKPEYQEGKINKIHWQLRLQKRVVAEANRVIVPCFYLKDLVVGWGAKSERVEVIYNAISKMVVDQKLTTETAKKEIGLSGDILLGVGRLIPWKGFDFLIKIMPEILKINENFKLVIVGDGPEYKNYQKLINELGLLEKVFLVGQLQQNQLKKYLAAATIFLLNSGYEGLSHATLEAMKYKLPVLISDKGGNDEIVDNEINGLLIEYNGQEAWLAAIRKVWQDDEFREKIAQNSTADLPTFEFNEMVCRVEKELISN